MNVKNRRELETRKPSEGFQGGCALTLLSEAFARVEAELLGGLNHGF